MPLADLALQLALPPGALCFRGWEAAGPRSALPMPFAPDRRFATDRAYGDLANISNRRALRVYRAETFTTDALGCRNDPAWARERRIDALFLGGSFIAGVGQDDAHTVAALLSGALHRRVYNAGGIATPAHELVTRIAAHFDFRRGPVLREILVRGDVLAGLTRPPPTAPASALWQHVPLAGPTPLAILALHALEALEDDRLLPNRHAGRAALRTLSSGAPILFLHDELGVPEIGLDRDPLTDWLSAQGYAVTVVLMPTKYQVYRPYLAGQSAPDGPDEAALADLARRFTAAGYRVVEPFARLRAAAANLADPVYWPDDTHLTPAGARIVADEIARVWHPSGP